jgi:hypothetical protein
VNLRRFAATALAVVIPVGSLALSSDDAFGAALPAAWSTDVSRSLRSSPTIADVDGDGENEVVVASVDGKVRRLSPDGKLLSTWTVDVGTPGGTAIESSPTVADLDGDGKREVIVTAGSLDEVNQHGGIIVFNSDGSTRWKRKSEDVYNQWTGGPPDGYGDGVFSTPAVGDVDGDGRGDIVYGGWDHNIYVFNADGAEIGRYPHDDTVWSSPALLDIDGDGRSEIFIGADSSAGISNEPFQNHAGGLFYGLRLIAEGLRPMWVKQVGETIMSSPVIGDINGDGRPEAVVGSGHYYENADSRKVFAWHLDDGSPVPGWPKSTGAPVFGSPALGDLDGDNRPEVVIGSQDHRVYAWRGDGSQMWAVEPVDPSVREQDRHITSAEIKGAPVVADLNGDGKQDVAIGTGFATFALDGRTGGLLFDPINKFWSSWAAPAVGNLGGTLTLVATGAHASASPFRVTEGIVSGHPLPTSSVAPAWPQWRGGPTHIGQAANEVPAPNLDPITRIAGNDRLHTSILVSQNSFPGAGSAPAAVVANAERFADALAGAPLAAAKNGPLLLSPSDNLTGEIATELKRVVKPGGTIYLLGGEAALSRTVNDHARSLGFQTVRYSGADRFETAVAIAKDGLGNPTTILFATGHDFPDALAGGAAAAKAGAAILLTNGPEKAAPTEAYLANRTNLKKYALGGADRYETAVKVAQAFFTGPTTIGVASGTRFPDALAGGAHIADKQAPMLLVPAAGGLPGSVQTYLKSIAGSVDDGWAYGGATAVGSDVVRGVQQAITE